MSSVGHGNLDDHGALVYGKKAAGGKPDPPRLGGSCLARETALHGCTRLEDR